MTNTKQKTRPERDIECSKNWHIFLRGQDKRGRKCKCGKVKWEDSEFYKMINRK